MTVQFFFFFFSERQQWTLFQIFWVNYCNRQAMDRILPNIMSEILHSQLRELQQRKGFCLWQCLCSLLITEWTRKGFCLKYQLWLVLHTQLSEAEQLKEFCVKDLVIVSPFKTDWTRPMDRILPQTVSDFFLSQLSQLGWQSERILP